MVKFYAGINIGGFLGGILCIYLGKYYSWQLCFLASAIVMVLGNLLIAIAPKEMFYYGIAFSIIGTGFFKPNVSSMVGELYHEDDPRRDAGYGMFYAGINIGGFSARYRDW